MLTRLTHAAIAFAITVVVYQAYVLLAAPLIEPTAKNPTASEGVFTETPQATHKHRALLAAYFPPGHWTLTQPPITAENDEAMIVLSEFNPRDDGQVRVKKCALLFFPGGRDRGEAPPRDAVILEAPHGAQLQMDAGVRSGVSGFGKLQSGKLLGKITVRSDMREPGPDDDLLLTTHDLDIQEGLIYTREHVDMQLGPHRGSGRQLEIRLVEVERSRAAAQGPNIGNIDSLVVFHDVQALLAPGQLNQRADPAQGKPTSDSPPVQITCDGQFRFDFSKQIASFDTQVQLRQVHPQGQLDQMQCEKLSVYFSKTADSSDEPNESPLGNLQAATIEAVSSQDSPVVFDAQSQQASGRCERVLIETLSKRVTFDRGQSSRFVEQKVATQLRPVQEVELFLEGNEIHAKQVQYTAPPEGSGQRIGNFRASGSGWLRARTSDKSDAEPFEVRWTENMRLRRIDGKPVLTLNGRPRLDMVGMGQLWADHIDLYLRESALDGSEDELLPGEVVPERLVAGGKIAIDSAQLRGKVKQLEVRFEYAPSDLLLTSPSGQSSTDRHAAIGRRGGTRAYGIVGETLDMLVTVRQGDPEVTSIDVDGQVQFNESPTNLTTKPPLQVVADHLRVDNADSPSAEIKLSGRPATITADGMLIRTENLQVNRGTSRAWVNAPGEIEMLVDRDLSGNPLPAPQPMTIRWQRSMELDQDRITFQGSVQVQSVEGTLDTQQMVVTLSAPVRFDGAANQSKTEVAQLKCSGGISARFSQRDAFGLASVQTIKLEDSFIANLQNGQLQGVGPGWMESVHLSDAANSLGEFAQGSKPARLASAATRAQQRLKFLGVQFNRGIRGNLHSRQVQVVGDVDAVYGPVDAWEQRLPLTKRGMPGPETLWISCERLGVAESPLARLDRSRQSGIGPIELEAVGDEVTDVTIEGPAGERGNFTTRSQRAKYDQTKRTFILEGTTQRPANISHQEFRGGPSKTTNALKIIYFQDSGDVKVHGLMPGQIRQLAPSR